MKKFFLIFFLLSIFGHGHAQSPLWENLFPANRANITLIKTKDSGFITSGIQYGPVQYPSNIAKYDTAGNLIWQRAGRVMHTGEQDLQQTQNGKFLHTGNVFRNQPGNGRDTYLQQIDENGDTINTWARTYTEPSADYPTEMLLLDNGDVLIAGLAFIPYYFTLRRTDSLGNTIWYRKYANSFSTYGTRMIHNRSGNLVLLGMTRPQPTPWHPLLMEVNLNGDSLRSGQVVLQDITIKEETKRIYNNLILTSDGGYAFGGVFPNNGFIAKTDSLFNLLWYYEIPPQQASAQEHITFKIIELQDSTLLFLSKDNHPAATQFYITRLSKDGDSLSTTSILSQVCPNGNMQPYNWQFLADSSIVICGWCVSNNQAYIGRWGNLNFPLPMGFENTPTDTTPVSVTQPLLHQPTVKLYPNPAKGQVRVQLFGTTAKATLQLYSVTGKKVLERPISGAPQDIPLRGLPQGLYLYRVLVQDQVLSGKLVVE